MTRYAVRVRTDTTGYYAAIRGETLAVLDTRDEAERIVRAAVNGGEWEVVEVEG